MVHRVVTMTDASDDIIQTVRTFIASNFYLSDKFKELNPDLSLMDTGIVDSTGILEVIEFLEEKFEMVIENDEIIPENLDTINNIEKFVRRKKGL